MAATYKIAEHTVRYGLSASVNWLWNRLPAPLQGLGVALAGLVSELGEDPWSEPEHIGLQLHVASRWFLPLYVDLRRADHYSLGAGHDCDIRLPSGPPIAGYVCVQPGSDVQNTKLTYLPHGEVAGPLVDVPSDPCIQKSGVASDNERQGVIVDVGNVLDFDGATIEIVDPRPPYEAKRRSAYRLARWMHALQWWIYPTMQWSPRLRRRLGQDVSDAVRGRRGEREALVQRLSIVVDSAESIKAQRLFERGRRVTLSLVGGFSVLCFVAILESLALNGAHASTSIVVIAGAAVLCTMATSTLINAAGGAVFFAIGAGTAVVVGMGAADITPNMLALFVLMLCPVMSVIGHQFEIYWSPVPNVVRSKSHNRSMPLGVGLVALSTGLGFGEPELGDTLAMHVAVAAIGLAIIVWSVLAVRAYQRRLLQKTPVDTLLLLDVSWTFWRQRLRRRVLATTLAIVPIVGMLNSPAVPERVAPQRFAAGGYAGILWDGAGSSSEPDDRPDLELFTVDSSEWQGPEFPLRLEGAFGERAVAKTPDASARDILLQRGAQVTANQVAGSRGSDDLWCSPDRPGIALSRCTVLALGPSEFEDALRVMAALRFPAAVLIAFGILLMWRAPPQGGAVAVALWAFGYASAVDLVITSRGSFTPWMLDALVARWGIAVLDLHAVPLRAIDTLHAVLRLMNTGLMCAAIIGCLSTAVVVRWYWPEPWTDETGSPRFGRVLHRMGLIVAVPVLGATVLIGLAAFGRMLGDVAGGILLGFASISPIITPLTFGWMVAAYRRRHAHRRPPSVSAVAPPSPTWAELALFALPALLTGAVILGSTFAATEIMIAAAYIAALILLLLVVHLVIRRPEWGLSGGHTAASLVAAVGLPAVWILIEGTAADWIETVSPFPRSTATLLLGVAAIVVLERGRRFVNKSVERGIAGRNVRAALSRARDIIDRLGERAPDAIDRLRQFLSQDLQLQDVALYTRVRGPEFRVLCAASAAAVPASVNLSDSLLTRLSGARRFVDLRDALHDLDYIAAAPEMWRL